ncbi:MAG: TraB/GumN family protein [Pseudomonadota bacterium]
MMRLQVKVLLLLWPVFAILGLFSVAAASPVTPGVALWQLEHENGGRAVLMGTVHLLPDDDSWADKRIRAASKAADMLVLEAVAVAASGQSLQAFALKAGFIADTAPGLSTRLTALDNQRLADALATLHIPPGTMERMQPWFAALNLTLTAVMKQGFEADQGAESWLRGRFERAGEPVGVLESATAGLMALATLPQDLQLEMLRAAFVQVESQGEDIDALYTAWRSGDQMQLTALIMDPEQFHPAVHKAVLVDRNANWVKPILDYLETPEEEFIAVGAAHMVGPGNLIEMLQKAGVRVERLQ